MEVAADALSSGGIVMLSAQMWRCEYCIAALCAFVHGIVHTRGYRSEINYEADILRGITNGEPRPWLVPIGIPTATVILR